MSNSLLVRRQTSRQSKNRAWNWPAYRNLRRLWSGVWRLVRRRAKPGIAIKKLGRTSCRAPRTRITDPKPMNTIKGLPDPSDLQRPIRIATFNAAMFSLAPAVPLPTRPAASGDHTKPVSAQEKSGWEEAVTSSNHPNVISKKHLPHHHSTAKRAAARTKPKVSINRDNEISPPRKESAGSSRVVMEENSVSSRKITCNCNGSNIPVRSPVSFPASPAPFSWNSDQLGRIGCESILDVLTEVNADVLALQDVKAEEEKAMKPLSDLAAALGMNYVFAESWAPEYGNAVLSRWPIKSWRVCNIVDDDDFRNVVKVRINVPWMGEMEFHCTQLDHLDENWRLKQVKAIMQTTDSHHILAGGLNSLTGSDYSSERWSELTQFHEEMGKPAPKVEAMKFLGERGYVDAGDSAGEREPVVIIVKGQSTLPPTCNLLFFH